MIQGGEYSYQTMHRLETPRLVLRPVSSGDVDHYLNLLSDPTVMRFVGLQAGELLNRSRCEYVVSTAIDVWHERGYGRWSLFTHEENAFVGYCGFRTEAGQPEFICVVHEEYWGKGFASEAGRECLKHGFSNLGFAEVTSYCRPTHRRARKLLDRLGAEFLGYTDFHGITGAAYRFLPT